jgi:hypothetical protein
LNKRIAALKKSQEDEIATERDDIARLVSDAPLSLQIPTKVVGEELQADLKDEFFGGFVESDHDEPERQETRRRKRKPGQPADVPGCEWRWLAGWGWGLFSRPYLGREYSTESWFSENDPIRRFRLGEPPGRDVATTIEQPGSKIARQAVPRRWAAHRPSNGPHPYVIQAARQAEQQVPEPTLERDRAEHLERLGEGLALLAVPTDPNSGPSRSFARGVLHEERAGFFGQHTERRVQALFTRRYRPSRALEEKRFPKLAKVKIKLVPKVRGAKPDLRAELEPLVAAYQGPITVCPPETTTAKLNKRPRGRPPDGDRAMTGAERKRRHRNKLRVIVETPSPSGDDTNVRTVSRLQRQLNLGRLDQVRGDHAKRKAA